MSKITVKQLMDLHGISYDEWFKVENSKYYRGEYYISKNNICYYKTPSGIANNYGCDESSLIDLLLGDIKKFTPWIPQEGESIWIVNVMDYANPHNAEYYDLEHLELFDLGLAFKYSDEDKAKARYNEVVEWLKKTKKIDMV